MKTPLRYLFDFGAETATHIFDRMGHLKPMWIGVNKKGSHIPLIIADMSDKDRVAQVVRGFLKKEGSVRYVSMLECWTYEGKGEPTQEMLDMLKEGSLEHHPDRREAITIIAEDDDGSVITGRFYILRPEHGKPMLSPIKVDPEMEDITGRFVKMFD